MEGLPVVLTVVAGPLSDTLGRAGQSELERSAFCRSALGLTMGIA